MASIQKNLPWVRRVGLYANAKSILKKTSEELKELRNFGLGIAYLGLETGNDELLEKIQKGADAARMISAAKRIKEAGIELSVTVLLGIGGTQMSAAHAVDTARVLNEMDPNFVGALTVMVVPGTPLYEQYRSGEFILPDTFEFIRELETMISRSDFNDCFFTSNHASNYLPIRARLPIEKEKTLETIRQVLESGDKRRLRPEFLRGL